MEIRPMVGVVVVVINKHRKLLMGLRIGKHATNTWGFPGGHLEFGESFEEAAIRETKEETGIVLSTVHFWWLENVIFSEEEKHYVTIFMRAYVSDVEPIIMEPEKCAAWIWAEWESMPMPLMPGIVMLKKQRLHPLHLNNQHHY